MLTALRRRFRGDRGDASLAAPFLFFGILAVGMFVYDASLLAMAARDADFAARAAARAAATEVDPVAYRETGSIVMASDACTYASEVASRNGFSVTSCDTSDSSQVTVSVQGFWNPSMYGWITGQRQVTATGVADAVQGIDAPL